MKKLLFLLIFLVAFLCVNLVSASADSYRISDESSMLGGSLYTAEESLKSAYEATRVKFFVYIHEGYVSESRMQSSFSISDDSDAVMLEIEKSGFTYYYELYLYGRAWDLISFEVSDEILDDPSLYSSIKAGDLSLGISIFAELCKDAILDAKKAAGARAIFIPIVIGIISGASGVGIVVYRYKKKLKAPSYPLSKYVNLNLVYSDDSFIGSNVVRTRISSSSGRSGGRSGGSRGRR